MNARRTLVLVDADDTLWENYRFFSDVIAEWARWMAARGVPPARAIATLEEVEDRNIPRSGYGSAPFVTSLRETFFALLPDAGKADVREFSAFADSAEASLRDHEIQLLHGVEAALDELAARCSLVLFTKGRADEQLAKLARSGVAHRFDDARVVAEKHVEAFAAECVRRHADPAQTWMVGNSARSDINPARRAGLRTIHVPHPAPWHRDEETLVDAGPATLVARTFADVPHLLR